MLVDIHDKEVWVHLGASSLVLYYIAYLCAFGNKTFTFFKRVNLLVLTARKMKNYFDKVVEWDKNLIKKCQDKFGWTDYQVVVISFAKGFVIGAILL